METDQECQLQFVSFSSFHFGSRREQWISVIWHSVICHRYLCTYLWCLGKCDFRCLSLLFCDCLSLVTTSIHLVYSITLSLFPSNLSLIFSQFVVFLSSGPIDTQSNRNHSSENYYPFPTQNDEMKEKPISGNISTWIDMHPMLLVFGERERRPSHSLPVVTFCHFISKLSCSLDDSFISFSFPYSINPRLSWLNFSYHRNILSPNFFDGNRKRCRFVRGRTELSFSSISISCPSHYFHTIWLVNYLSELCWVFSPPHLQHLFFLSPFIRVSRSSTTRDAFHADRIHGNGNEVSSVLLKEMPHFLSLPVVVLLPEPHLISLSHTLAFNLLSFVLALCEIKTSLSPKWCIHSGNSSLRNCCSLSP